MQFRKKMKESKIYKIRLTPDVKNDIVPMKKYILTASNEVRTIRETAESFSKNIRRIT